MARRIRVFVSERKAFRNRNRNSNSNRNKRRPTSSPTADLNDDLLRQIFLCLGAKPLFRFQSVCKHWRSLLSNPLFLLDWKPKTVSGLFFRRFSRFYNPNIKFNFIPIHTENQYNSNSISLCKATLGSLNFANDSNGIKILQACNGLLLCSSTGSIEDDISHIYYVYNPTTKQFTTLPRPRSGGVLGSGPEESRNIIQFKAGVFLNGAIHWPSSSTNRSLYFNVNEELLQTMPMPPTDDNKYPRSIRYFGESRGHLHLIEFYDSSTLQFNIFEMKMDYSEWFVRYHVDLNTVVTVTATPPDFFVLCLLRGEIEEDSALVLYMVGQVISYNLNDKTSNKICDLKLRHSDVAYLKEYKYLIVHQYIETPFQV
ncbi:hypothetical protein F0562_029298 [Nyssa sinensis]|uniref:F-box domain-containing protein n=1 Tax=Nyssa sinensis TaxID=561372 RepID=A0A5J5B2N4_9ASTE|nr:hypothetical protein F0562_029298 [Nyssa sinensis]